MLSLDLFINVFLHRVSEEWSGWIDWTRVEELIWVEMWFFLGLAEIVVRITFACVEALQVCIMVHFLPYWCFSVIEVMVESHEVLLSLRSSNNRNECRSKIFHLDDFLLSDLNSKLTSFESI